MAKSTPQPQGLDDDVLAMFGEAQKPAEIPADIAQRMRSRVMASIERAPAADDYVTVRADDEGWEELLPKVERKVLYLDPETGGTAFLLRAQPGAEAPAHEHEHDEVCVMLEGEIFFDDIHLKKGDYHLAKQGTWHGVTRTETGALVFQQTIPRPL